MSRPAGERFELEHGAPDYPETLAASPDPPKRLYGIGNPEALVPGIGIVGARKATPYGLRAATLLAGWAAKAGYVVTSGGAIGCDQAAHRAALEANGRTVAVMAGGPDVSYPRNAGVLLGLIAASGAVVSEHAWGTEPRRWAFRTRNRIIAGLSAGVLVVEAALGSGTFSTAEYAADAGREVLAVPGSIFAPGCAGANRLIRQGAVAITEADDLRCALEPLLGPPAHDLTEVAYGADTDPALAALAAEALRPDDLARLLGWDIVETVRHLGRLEATGKVRRHANGTYGMAR